MTLTRIQLERAMTSRHLQLILMPTEQCNFRCTYCYEDFAIGRMREPIVRGVKNLMRRRAAELDTLSIQWFGGEPLAAKGVVMDISRYIGDLCATQPKLQYRAAMTTNGYFLDPATLAQLVRLGIGRYQISLDGWGASHDLTRKRADGAGTFDRIWANLEAMRKLENDFSILLRIHVQPQTIESVDRLLTELTSRFADDPRFDVAFFGVSNWGGANASTLQIYDGRERERIVRSLQARWRPSQQPAGGAPLATDRALSADAEDSYVCYAARPNSLIIRANGSIGKCTVMLSDDRNKIGTLEPDGTVSLVAGRLAPWLRGFKSLDDDELGCPARGLPGAAKSGTLLDLAG